jgi:hypothetical protein
LSIISLVWHYRTPSLLAVPIGNQAAGWICAGAFLRTILDYGVNRDVYFPSDIANDA